MEDNLEIHLDEVHLEEIHLEDHHLVHMLDQMDPTNTFPRMFMPPWFASIIDNIYESKQPNYPYKKLQYPTSVNDIDPNAHIKVLKRPLKIMVKP
jgi:hypothetical protein